MGGHTFRGAGYTASPVNIPTLLPDISASTHPEQEIVNWANRKTAIDSAEDPPYLPYFPPKVAENPWIPPKSEHVSA